MLRLALRSDPRLLCVVRAAVGEMAALSGFTEAEKRLMVLAVDEALTNVIRHAYRGSVDRPMQISFYRAQGKTAEALEIRIVDRGTPVDPAQLVGRSLEDIQPGGLGLHFIRETMDSVVFRHIAGRNYLRLIKSVQSAKTSSTEEET